MNINKQYDKIGERYIKLQKKFFTTKLDKPTEAMKKCLPDLKGKIILDIGCGHGKDILLYEKLDAKEIWGMDSSQVMINEAKKLVKDPQKLSVASIDNTYFKNNQFDVVLGRFAFHYLEDMDKGYEEMARILKSRGILILVVDHPIRALVGYKKKAYHIRENIKISLYNKKIKLLIPTHTFAEYLSPKFFKHFYLEHFIEDIDKELGSDAKKTPGFMVIKAVKR
ncbi:methyltransferase domain-containing protein [Candidatus Woesearchaeota archaeon]|nr:methyltransferase domain-containing protein [Candidatus Woesearchaeota archaeon]HIH55238.1 class I SAM-dependent methyltransferase [Candidatus Woesearchaeota archaeon]HIJ01977.1 class I SAM-dependent methyltransferase [Candidatus Woesearchaeota archaeon]